MIFEQTVYIVDDDEAVRDSLLELLGSVGLKTMVYSSADEFLSQYRASVEGCLLLDIRMPGMSGLELQQKLYSLGSVLSIVFITGHGDVQMAVDAMKRGAIDFIEKPFRDQELLDSIHSALQNSRDAGRLRDETQLILKRLTTLTKREVEVFDRIVLGQANKVIAQELNISQRTVENHRAHILEKMHVRTTTTLVKAAMSVNYKSGVDI